MYCSNCGKQIPDNNNFCNYCGFRQPKITSTPPASSNPYDAYTPPVYTAPENSEYRSSANSVNRQEAASQQKPVSQPKPAGQQKPVNQTVKAAKKVPEKKAPKDKKKILISLAIVLCAYLIGKFVIAPAMLSDPKVTTTTNPFDISADLSSAVTVVNPDYQAILNEAFIVHVPPFFSMMDTTSLIMKTEDGVICCADYGHDGDIIKLWVETMYVPLNDYTEEQKTAVQNSMKEEFASIEALSFCTVEYKMLNNSLKIICTYNNADDPATLKEMYNAGITTVNDGVLSMNMTEDTLISQGFIKK